MGGIQSTLASNAPNGRELAAINYKKNAKLTVSLYENYTILFQDIRTLVITKLQKAAKTKKQFGLYVPFDKNSPTEEQYVKTKKKFMRDLRETSEASSDDDSEDEENVNVERFHKKRVKFPVSTTTLYTSLKTEAEGVKKPKEDETTTVETFFTETFSKGIGGKITKFISTAIFGTKTVFGDLEMYTDTLNTLQDLTLCDKFTMISNMGNIHATLNPTMLYSIINMLHSSSFAGTVLRDNENFQKLYQADGFFDLLEVILDPTIVSLGRKFVAENETYRKDFQQWPTFLKTALTTPVEELLRLFLISIMLTLGVEGFECLNDQYERLTEKNVKEDFTINESDSDSSTDEDTINIEQICKAVREFHAQLMIFHDKFSSEGQEAIAAIGKLRNIDTINDFL